MSDEEFLRRLKHARWMLDAGYADHAWRWPYREEVDSPLWRRRVWLYAGS